MKLLVTYDGSSTSASVIRPAERLALKFGAEIILLSVNAAGPRTAGQTAGNERALEEEWQRSLDPQARALACPARAEVRQLAGQASVPDVIIDAAVQHEAALIMMATRGENELRHAFIGSTALGVTARSPIPVVLVRSSFVAATPEHEIAGPPRIVVTYDGSDASRSALVPACSIARGAGGEIILVWIHQPIPYEVALEPDEEKRRRILDRMSAEMTSELERLAASLDCRTRVIVRPILNERWNVVDEIRAIGSEEQADLICMATRGHSRLRHALFGSNALEMVGRSELPVMLVRAEV